MALGLDSKLADELFKLQLIFLPRSLDREIDLEELGLLLEESVGVWKLLPKATADEAAGGLSVVTGVRLLGGRTEVGMKRKFLNGASVSSSSSWPETFPAPVLVSGSSTAATFLVDTLPFLELAPLLPPVGPPLRESIQLTDNDWVFVVVTELT